MDQEVICIKSDGRSGKVVRLPHKGQKHYVPEMLSWRGTVGRRGSRIETDPRNLTEERLRQGQACNSRASEVWIGVG